jgi:hypothetical protein
MKRQENRRRERRREKKDERREEEKERKKEENNYTGKRPQTARWVGNQCTRYKQKCLWNRNR